MNLLFIGFLLTLAAHIAARMLQSRFHRVPLVVTALALTILLLLIFRIPFESYYAAVDPLFDRLLGYVTVALAIPLALMDFRGIPIKRMSGLLLLSTALGVLVPVGLSAALHLGAQTELAFVTRAVTTPIALNITEIIGAPEVLASLIIVISGLLGAAAAPYLLKNVHDDRAYGLAMGLVAHAIGTAEAWQVSPTAGRFSAFGMAINGLLTALWAPWVFAWFY